MIQPHSSPFKPTLADSLLCALAEAISPPEPEQAPAVTAEVEAQAARIPEYGSWIGFDDYRVGAGMSDGQAANYTRYGNVPMPKQLEFAVAARLCDLPDGPNEIGMGGARGPGKSWSAFAQIIDDCLRFAGIKVLYLRHTEKAIREQFHDLAAKLLRHMPGARILGNRVVFPNGSTILVGGFKDDRQALRYQGIEYDILVIEEATQLREKTYITLRLSLRSSRVINGVPFRPRTYLNTNPLGIGHMWFKQRFVDNERAKLRGEDFDPKKMFIFSTVDDNVFVHQDYIDQLEELSDAEYRAYRLGDWDVSAGAYFDNFSEAIHVIPALDDLSFMVRIWCSMDFGFNHPNVIYLHAEDGDGVRYTVDELVHRKRHPDEIAADIHPWLAQYGLTRDDLDYFFVGADAFAQTGRAKASVAQQYQAHGISMTRAYVQPGSRVEGSLHLSKLLGSRERSLPPQWYMTTRCRRLRETLPYLERDPNNAESVRKVDADSHGRGGDDAYDALIYGQLFPHASTIA